MNINNLITRITYACFRVHWLNSSQHIHMVSNNRAYNINGVYMQEKEAGSTDEWNRSHLVPPTTVSLLIRPYASLWEGMGGTSVMPSSFSTSSLRSGKVTASYYLLPFVSRLRINRGWTVSSLRKPCIKISILFIFFLSLINLTWKL